MIDENSDLSDFAECERGITQIVAVSGHFRNADEAV